MLGRLVSVLGTSSDRELDLLMEATSAVKKNKSWDFSGGLAVKTPCSQCRGSRFDSWLGNQDPTCSAAKKGKKKS